MPNEPAKEDLRQREWYARDRRPLLLDYAEQELAKGERVIAANDQWLAVIPWWAVWPFEVLVLPRRPWSRLVDLPGGRRPGWPLGSFAAGSLGIRPPFRHLVFAYSMGWHGAPFDGAEHPE